MLRRATTNPRSVACLKQSVRFLLSTQELPLRSAAGTCRIDVCFSSSSQRQKSTVAAVSRPQAPSAIASSPSPSSRRPYVNGKAVAFHVRDLDNEEQTPASRRQSPSQLKSEKESDLVVVLDMDECLIHSQFMTPMTATVYAQQVQRRHSNNSDADQRQRRVDSFRIPLPDGEHALVNVRPGLMEFIDAVTAKYETHVYTAAQKVYASKILDRIDPTGEKFAGRWYRESCDFCGTVGAHIKTLENLPPVQARDNRLDRVVLVDNNPLSFLSNPMNGILVKSFFNDPADNSLAAVWNMIEELDEADDVRPILDERFGLSEGLKNVQEESAAGAAAAVAA